jgi:hypothetical protein
VIAVWWGGKGARGSEEKRSEDAKMSKRQTTRADAAS